MTKQLLLVLFLSLSSFGLYAQKGSISGNVKDGKTGEALIGASVFVDGTTLGTVTDFDGNYTIPNVPAGTVTVKCSFISYETSSKENVSVSEGNSALVNFVMGESTVALEDVKVVAKANRESEVVLLIDQKKSIGIKQSIGAQELASQGVSDAAAAASKISGVTKNEGSGDVYVRGLGDRYLSTTMNGLPIPSDDVDKKNIDLNLFGTDIIKNIGINKTYSAGAYADQSSGNVDIVSKTLSEKITIGLGTKVNTNVLQSGVFDNFKTTQNFKDVSFGFYDLPYQTVDAVNNQSWNTEKRDLPIGYDFSILAGKKFKLFDKDLSVFATLSHENESEYKDGIYKKYRSNVLDNSFNDVEQFETKINTTGLLNMTYDFDANNNINFNTVWVHKTSDQLYEQGRNGEGYVFDQDPQEDGAFVRDQNLKETNLLINQLLGSHKINEKNTINWAVAYNQVKAEEPNRIRNEVNILDENTVQFAHVGDFQQRKSQQNIEDSELNGYLKDEMIFIDQDDKKFKLNFGGNFRMKERDFSSQFIGVRAKGVQVSSIDNLDEALLNRSLYSNNSLIIRDRVADTYNATLDVFAAYVDAGFQINKLSGTVGVRYEKDEMEIDWNVANYVGRVGSLSNSYDNMLPALNVKYQLNEKSALRFAASKTITLPEFKELAPFEYVSPTGRVTKGNPDLKNSENYNFDLKWEMFPTAKQLVSVSAFYKMIKDPINLAQTRGSSGNFVYENTGDKADVYGFEFETRFALIKAETTEMPELNLVLNATKMWFKQDLLEEFQYNNKTESDLQGASDFILNGTLSFSNNKEKEFMATLTGNYSSDKVFALGAPEDFANSATLFNNEIIEKGFVTLDLVLSKKLSDRISMKLSGKNLLNPDIEQTQEIKPLSGEASNEVVSSYKKGISLSLGVKINLNK
ncbi:TonB-dependent receptor [Marinifilum caeruleilacunae]|uniref:TonB-dependent receptor n=1 Tax=Marinifilum caeruleilacunae TaxID=2499076 RepID=A0ABX1X079_9BACT|nr:TonB-dependent receptor [Marinifilum caeruleilacunae]NOU61561.1 TonB-dependent receptor [Marinifilum caeruleilacunae]